MRLATRSASLCYPELKFLIEVQTVFAGKDASRALAQSSLKQSECRPDYEDLADEHKKVLDDWYTFFSKRYNVKGRVAS